MRALPLKGNEREALLRRHGLMQKAGLTELKVNGQ